MDWNPNSMPVVDKRMPAIQDYILTIWTLISAFVLVRAHDYGPYLSDSQDSLASYFAISVLFTTPWWIWRSFKATLYYKQHRPLGWSHLFSLVATNAIAYGFLLFVLWEIPAYFRGERLFGLIVVIICLLVPTYFYKKR